MKNWVLRLFARKSKEAVTLEKQIQFAALYGLLAVHGFRGGVLILWRMGMKIMAERAAIQKGGSQHGTAS